MAKYGDFLTRQVKEDVSRTGIYHCYTHVPEKIIKSSVVGVGSSDHLGLVIKKLAKFPVSRPQTVSRRSYKSFDVRSFLTEVYSININQEVSESNDVDEVAEVFENSFRIILDKHAPMKTIQIRKNFSLKFLYQIFRILCIF